MRTPVRPRGLSRPTLSALRTSLWAALGVSAAACGGTAVVEQGSGGAGATASGTATTTTGSTVASSGTGTQGVCEGSTPILQASGAESGFEKCPDGTIHRVKAAICDISVPVCSGLEDVVLCASNADCTDYPNGQCAHYEVEEGGLTAYCGCAYPCATDKDCPNPGSFCVCDGVTTMDRPWSSCSHVSECGIGTDCPSGECGLSTYFDGCGWDVGLTCRDSGDECRLSAECDVGLQCVASYGDSTWSCTGSNCAIGRPLVVDERVRKAPSTRRSDWAPGASSATPNMPSLQGLSAEQRQLLTDHYGEIAAMEHASIGSFARFSLELLSVGAPSELLADTQRAALDEVRHAEIAYALASVYAGKPMGPGPLDVRGVLPHGSVEAIVDALVVEACLGETVGAAEARLCAEQASDPAIIAIHTRIAEDETRHAELAFRALAWLLRSEPRLRGRIEQALQRGAETLLATSVSTPSGLEAHGLCASADIRALRKQVVTQVVMPCVEALLA